MSYFPLFFIQTKQLVILYFFFFFFLFLFFGVPHVLPYIIEINDLKGLFPFLVTHTYTNKVLVEKRNIKFQSRLVIWQLDKLAWQLRVNITILAMHTKTNKRSIA